MHRLTVLLILWLLGPGLSAQEGMPWLTIDDIQARPDTTLRLAFHFVGLPDGRNFVPAGQDSLRAAYGGNEKLTGEIYAWYIMRELDKRFRTALLDYPPSKDTKLRFGYAAGEGRPVGESLYYYRHDERPRPVPGAYNVVFTRYRGRGMNPNGSTRGAGSHTLYIYGTLETFLRGGADTWSPARTLAHELGHALSLDHTFKCDNPCAGQGFTPETECFGVCAPTNTGQAGSTSCYGGSQRELMMGYGSQLHLTPCETERMWNFLLGHR